jgi:hypothetical protein
MSPNTFPANQGKGRLEVFITRFVFSVVQVPIKFEFAVCRLGAKYVYGTSLCPIVIVHNIVLQY